MNSKSFLPPAPEPFQNADSCWICNGYYGPSYEEPVCGACHSFLFSSTAVEDCPTRVPESDDEDSGNDEPPYNAAGVNPSHSNANVAENLRAAEDENMEEDVDDEDDVPEDIIEANVMAQDLPGPAARAENELPLVRPRPNPPRNVLQYLDLLSIPRQSNKNDPRIEALATEGEW